MVDIRPERAGDHAAIGAVTARAFAGDDHGDQTEPRIIERLRAAGALTVSLVAIKGADLIGHVAFSPVAIDGVHHEWFGLGPVSVDPDHQAVGIGTALIRAGLEHLVDRRASGCVVLGDPAYYRRFGFEHDDGLRYEAAPPGYFMRLGLTADIPPTGRVDYAPAFSG